MTDKVRDAIREIEEAAQTITKRLKLNLKIERDDRGQYPSVVFRVSKPTAEKRIR